MPQFVLKYQNPLSLNKSSTMGHYDIHFDYGSMNSYVFSILRLSCAHSNSASRYANAELQGCPDSKFSPSSCQPVTLSDEDRGHREVNASKEDESMIASNEEEWGTVSFNCPFVVYNLRHNSCSCTSISQTFMVDDPNRDCWISEALHSARENHLLSGTGDWLLHSREYRAWRHDGHSSLLWVRGSAGTGKSMLASATLNHLKANPRPGDITTFYFSDDRFKDSHTVRNILWTMLLGLKSRKTSNDSITCLDALSVEMQNAGNHLGVSQLRRFFSAMRHNLKSHETLLLIVDMLDECDPVETGLSELLRQFHDLASSLDQRHRIKFFVSSRPAMFYRYRNSAVETLQVDLDNEPLSRQDLMSYVRHGLQSLDIGLPPRDVSLLRNKLNCQAKTTFLWINLILRDLSVEAISRDSLDLISTVPSNIYEIYNRMIARISRNDRSLAHMVLTWVTHSARPLSLAEFNKIARLDTVLTESDVWRISGGLVVLAEDQTMGLVHLSAKEYFTSSQNELQDFTAYKHPHEMIAYMCLRSLSGVDLLRSLGILPASYEAQTTNAHYSATRSYAVSFGKLHYRLAEPHSSRLPGFLHSCLREALESNFEACKGYVSVSPIMRANLGNLQGDDFNTDRSIILNSYVTDVALMIAATFGWDRIARLELQMGAHSNLAHGVDKRTALHMAAQNGHRYVVEALLLHGADVNALTAEGCTPLYYAAIPGHYDTVQVLIKHGAGIESSDFYDRMTSSPRSQEGIFWNYVIESAISESCSDCGEMRVSYTVRI
jgi:hypothetical protein